MQKKIQNDSFCAHHFHLFLLLRWQRWLEQNYSSNVHWVFCIDTIGSMKTKGHMDLLRSITEKIGEKYNQNWTKLFEGDVKWHACCYSKTQRACSILKFS